MIGGDRGQSGAVGGNSTSLEGFRDSCDLRGRDSCDGHLKSDWTSRYGQVDMDGKVHIIEVHLE